MKDQQDWNDGKEDKDNFYNSSLKTIPIINESLQLDKELIEKAKVIFTKKVNQETVRVNDYILQEVVNVERVPKNEYVSKAPDALRYEGETLIIPIVKEVMVVEKRLIIVEELHITKSVKEVPYSQDFTVLKEEVHVERVPNNNTAKQ